MGLTLYHFYSPYVGLAHCIFVVPEDSLKSARQRLLDDDSVWKQWKPLHLPALDAPAPASREKFPFSTIEITEAHASLKCRVMA